MWQSQHEKHPRANGGDDHADDFGGDDVFDDVVHHRNLIADRYRTTRHDVGLTRLTVIAPAAWRCSPLSVAPHKTSHSGHRVGLASLTKGAVPPPPPQSIPLSSSSAKNPG